MAECILCGKQTGFFDKRNPEGYLCKECVSCIPSVIDCTSCSTEKLKYFREQNLRKRKVFDTTAVFGSLYLDNIHRIFCISPTQKKGEPAKLSDMFWVSEIDEIALCCVNPVCTGSGTGISVTCDAELYVRTSELRIKTIIARNEKCSYKVVDGHKVEWKEAARIAMFRSMFNQMIADENNTMLKEIRAVRNQKRIVWAEGVLMLKNPYTADELKQHYDFLKHNLQYSVSKHETEYYDSILEQAYKILQEHISEK